MSIFDPLEVVPPDPIFGITKAYAEDKNPDKVDLCVGIYYNEKLTPEIMKSVKKAESALYELEASKTYLPIDGDKYFLEATLKLLLGDALAEKVSKKTYLAQAPGGTGSLRVVGEFLKEHISSNVYISDPTWPNHEKVFSRAGLNVKKYPYYDNKTNLPKYEEMIKLLNGMKENTPVLFHGCCHNPTGYDVTKQQWKEISKICLEKKLVPIFDIAYQGFGDGLDEDAWAIRHFIEVGLELFVCYSFSKIFGLYAERAGAVIAIAQSEERAQVLGTNIKPIIRGNYSNPPKHGSSIVSYILHHKELSVQWRKELDTMRSRIKEMRTKFCHLLCETCTKKDYRYLEKRKGLFCFTGLEKSQVLDLRERYGIYMTGSGRVNVTGFSEENIMYTVNAINSVLG